MARNQEKANAMLNRFLKAKEDEAKGPVKKRPYLASECEDLGECEKWRGQIIREIGRKVAEIQNGMIGEHKIRDLNDEINKLLREKGHWEKQILKLGGADHARTGARVTDADGRVVVGTGGYLYFGAARNLPGVRELLEKKEVNPAEKKRRTRHEIFQEINIDYYGFRDDDDGLLEELEAKQEIKAVQETIAQWHVEERERQKQGLSSAKPRVTVHSTASGGVLKAHVPLPSEEEMRQLLIARRKQALLDQLGDQ